MWNSDSPLYVSSALGVVVGGPDLAPDSPYRVHEGVVHYRLTPAVWAWLLRAFRRAEESFAAGKLAVRAEDWEEARVTHQRLGLWVARRFPVSALKAALAVERPSLPAVGCPLHDAEIDRRASLFQFPAGAGPQSDAELEAWTRGRRAGVAAPALVEKPGSRQTRDETLSTARD